MSESASEAARIKQLVEQARKGDQDAFGSLYTMYVTPIYRFVFFRVKQKEEADDLTQTIFVKAWQAINRYEEQGFSFSTWLYRIARNTVIDYWKKKKDILFDDSERTIDVAEPTADGLEVKIQRQFDIEELRKVLTTLTEEQQTILTLKFINELENDEIEVITGKSQEAIRALQYRALKALRVQWNAKHTAL